MTDDATNKKPHIATRTLAAIGAGSMLFFGARFLIDFFGSAVPYSMPDKNTSALDSEDFIQFLSLVTDGTRRHTRISRLKNGVEFYPAYLASIRRAKYAINLEFYELLESQVGNEILAALTERAAAGVEVRVIVDALGSFATRSAYFDGLRAAGGQMCWYHPLLRWNTWPKANNRTHRKLLIVDGETGFIGGAGIADHWIYETSVPVWRDTVFCVEGEAVAGLISAFCENWLEASGEILSSPKQFGFRSTPGGAESFVVSSTPHGGGTQARILFQALINSARKTIRITTPYFIPDRSARQALIEAIQRGVEVQILTAGPRIDHPIIRKLSHRSIRHLLEAEAEIFEYLPSMIHAKLMTVDGLWNVVGSTNFDHRSFALNDEVNLAVLDEKLAATIEADFFDDLRESRKLSLSTLGPRTPLDQGASIVEHVLEQES
jgi:cardiolipin synthase A/B